MSRTSALPVLLAVLVALAGIGGAGAGEPTPAPGGIAWSDSLQAAQETARAQARPILLFLHTDG